MRWDRRQILGAGLAGSALAVAPLGEKGGWAAPTGPAMEFRIWRKGADIGRHYLRFERLADGLSVSSVVDIKVKVAFVTAFSFEQEADDVWHDGVLVRSRVRTDDDGEQALTEIEAGRNSVMIEGPKGSLEAPKGIMTDVCFWNRDIVAQPRLLDTSKGEFHSIASRSIGVEPIKIGNETRSANGYVIESQGGRSGEIWFDGNDEWVSARLITRGETLEYERL